MLEIGKYNRLKIVKTNSKGVFLDGKENGELFLPSRQVTGKWNPGDEIKVFIYLNSSNKITATTKKPFATVGQFAYLKVVSANTNGAFLNWGLDKDLLVPFREQKQTMKKGRSYVVYIYFDEKSSRIAASSKFNRYINKQPAGYREGQEVNLLIAGETDMGFKAIINRMHWGVLFKNEVFKTLQIGQEIKGFIKKNRSDGKIDLSLHETGYKKADELTKKIMDALKKEGGFIAVNDKSSPKLISKLFGESKSTFKNAIGALYKKQLIVIDENGISLSDKNVKK